MILLRYVHWKLKRVKTCESKEGMKHRGGEKRKERENAKIKKVLPPFESIARGIQNGGQGGKFFVGKILITRLYFQLQNHLKDGWQFNRGTKNTTKEEI